MQELLSVWAAVERGELDTAANLLDLALRTAKGSLEFPVTNSSLLNNTQAFGRYACNFFRTVAPARKARVLILQSNAFEFDPGNWQCWLGTSPILVRPDSSDEDFERFVGSIEGNAGYFPFRLSEPSELQNYFRDYYDLLRSGKGNFREEHAHRIACQLVMVRYFELVEHVHAFALHEAMLPSGLGMMAEVHGEDYFYVTQPTRVLLL